MVYQYPLYETSTSERVLFSAVSGQPTSAASSRKASRVIQVCAPSSRLHTQSTRSSTRTPVSNVEGRAGPARVSKMCHAYHSECAMAQKPLRRVVEDTIPEAHSAKAECGTLLSFVGDDRAGWRTLPTSRQPRSFPPLRQRDRQRLSLGLGLWRSRTLLWKKEDQKRARARPSAKSGLSGFRVLTASDLSPPCPLGS